MQPTPQVPHPLGRLKLGPRLAVGGMGEVFRATVELDGREVACVVKTLLPGVGETERALFAREARALAALTRLPARRFAHLIGADGDGGRLVVELVEGADLATVFAYRRKRGRPLPVAAVVALGVALAEALVELEAAEEGGRRLGLVHRDLHPGNVVVARDGAVKVIDLGVSTFAALEATSANPRGTLAYMAPEQLREGRVSAASDLYAVGLMLWEALVGEPARPPGDGSLGELLAYRHSVPEPAGARRAGVPEALDAWVTRALAVEAQARPSAAELLEGLRALAAEVGAVPAALAAVVEPLVDAASAPVRAAPTLGGARGGGLGGVRGEPAVGEEVGAEVEGAVGEAVGEAVGAAGVGASAAATRRVSGVGLFGLAGVGVVAVVALVFAVVAEVGGPRGAPAATPGAPGAAGSTAPDLAGSSSTAVDNPSGEERAGNAVGPPSEAADASPSVGSTRLDNAGQRWAPVLGAVPVAAVGSALAAPSSSPAPRSTVLDNAKGAEGEAATSKPPAPRSTVLDNARGTEDVAAPSNPPAPRSTVLDNARGTEGPTPGSAPANTPTPTAITVLSLEGPLHVSGLGASDLAPQTTAPLAPSTSGLLRLTGGSPPLTALVRVTHGDAGQLSATVGAPPGEVYEVTCGGRTRPTPAAGLALGERLACKVTAPDGRALAFALRPR